MKITLGTECDSKTCMRALLWARGYVATLNGYTVKLDTIDAEGITACHWSEEQGPHGPALLTRWVDVETVLIH